MSASQSVWQSVWRLQFPSRLPSQASRRRRRRSRSSRRRRSCSRSSRRRRGCRRSSRRRRSRGRASRSGYRRPECLHKVIGIHRPDSGRKVPAALCSVRGLIRRVRRGKYAIGARWLITIIRTRAWQVHVALGHVVENARAADGVALRGVARRRTTRPVLGAWPASSRWNSEDPGCCRYIDSRALECRPLSARRSTFRRIPPTYSARPSRTDRRCPGRNSRPHSSGPRRRWRRTATRREYRARRRAGCRTNLIARSVWHIRHRYRLRRPPRRRPRGAAARAAAAPDGDSGSYCRPSCCRSRLSRRFESSLRSPAISSLAHESFQGISGM